MAAFVLVAFLAIYDGTYSWYELKYGYKNKKSNIENIFWNTFFSFLTENNNKGTSNNCCNLKEKK